MTSLTKAEEAVLKTDTLGRVKTPVARREQLLEEFERSGLSGMKYAALVGIKYPTFAAWLQQRRRRTGGAGGLAGKPADSIRWLEAVVEQAHGGVGQPTEVVLELPAGIRVQIRTVPQALLAAALVRALEKSC